ncbi:MAG: 3-isopropylmalate dehydratase large subunit [Methylobacteriaceae bacterium]|nr:3-isopropylmalate dehydratase large subunit [Methylobacteriaceae bacterium]
MAMSAPRTLFEKVWDDHVVADLGDGFSLLHVDRHLLHDGAGPGLARVKDRGYTIARPDLTFATADHVISTARGRPPTSQSRTRALTALRDGTADAGIPMFDIGSGAQGIVHVIGPELGLTFPGALVVCADSHTCTHGALGAIGFGIGASELEHVLATQTIVQQRRRIMRISYRGECSPGVSAKDIILATVGAIGTAGGSGYAIEYAGAPIRRLEIEERLTLCNLSIELGAKIGMIAPDEKTFAYLEGRRFMPAGKAWDAAVAFWSNLCSDDGAVFDREETIDLSDLSPQVTYGTSPAQTIGIGGVIPRPNDIEDAKARAAIEAALSYMGLEGGEPILGVPVDWVFIGSCTNGRLSDLRIAAAVAKGRHVATHVNAWVVPGSETVQRAAEAEGLDTIFKAAGFAWREPGCSMCLAANGEVVPPGARCISTSNRNFVGRQGQGARTHLASPASAAAAAIAGYIVDHRTLDA